MSYRDDFYREENIIGYTGDIRSATEITVYFQQGNCFGRITQSHPNADNIGRNKVREYADYVIANNNDNGKAYEYYNGSIRHRSRNPFVAVTDDNRGLLAQAIERHQNVKPKHS